MQRPEEVKVKLRNSQSQKKLFGELPKLDFEFNVNDNVVKECADFFSNLQNNATAPSINFIVGLNGFGKTTHAVHYYKTYQDKYDKIFWFTPETLIKVAQNFIDNLQIKNDNQEKYDTEPKHTFNTLLKYLSEEQNWLLIFDGFDNTSFDFNLIIPKNEKILSNRHVLVTSSRADWTTNYKQKIYPLRNWNVGNAISFALHKFQIHNITAHIDDIVMLCESIMGLYPLGIAIVINYIIETKGKYPLKEIIKALITPDTNIYTEILSRVDGECASPKSILDGYIKELKQELVDTNDFELAIHCMQLLAFLDFSNPIPPVLIQRWCSMLQRTPSSSSIISLNTNLEKINFATKTKQDIHERITNSIISAFKKLCFIYEANEHIAPYFSTKKVESESKEMVYYSPISSVLKFFTNSRAFTDLFNDSENDYVKIILKVTSFIRNQLDYNIDKPSETPYYLMLLPHLHMCQQHLHRSSETKIRGISQKNIPILTDRFYCLLKLGTYYGHELRMLNKGLNYLEEAERLTFQLSLPIKACASLNSLLSALYMETNDLALAKIKSETIKVNTSPDKCSEVDVHLSFQRARNYQILGLHNECSKEIEIGLSIADNLKSDSKSHHEVMLYSLLGRNKMLLGDYKEADFLIQESTELRKDLRSKESLHPYTISQHLVSIPLHMYTGNYALADKLLVIMEEYVNKLGDRCDPAIKFSVLRFRGLLHRKQGNYNESYAQLELAKNYHDEVYHNKPFIYGYKILIELLKTNLITNCLTPDLRSSYLAQIASQIDQQYPQEHPDKASLLIIKGDLEISYSDFQEYTENVDKAISYYQAALAMQRKVFGYTDIHPTFINIHLKLASAYIRKHDTTIVNNHLEAADKAIKLFAKKNNIEHHILSMDYLLIKSRADHELHKFNDEHLTAIQDKLTKWNIYSAAHNISNKHHTILQLNKFVNNFNKPVALNLFHFKERVSSLIKIQSVFRGHLARKNIERRFNELFLAAGITRYGKAIVNQLFLYQETKQYLKGVLLLEKLKENFDIIFKSSVFPKKYLDEQLSIEEHIIQSTPFKSNVHLPNRNEKFIEGLEWMNLNANPSNFFSNISEVVAQPTPDFKIKVIDNIRNNRQQYSEFIPNHISDQMLASYCDNVLNDPEYFDGLVLEALMRFTQRAILIISPRKKIINITDVNRFNNSPIFIYYYFSNGHNYFYPLLIKNVNYSVENIIKSLKGTMPVYSILSIFNKGMVATSGERLKIESLTTSNDTALNISRQGFFSKDNQQESYWCIDTTNMNLELDRQKLLEYISMANEKSPQININTFDRNDSAENYLKSKFIEKSKQKGSHRIKGFIVKFKLSVDKLVEAYSNSQYVFIIDNVICVMKFRKDPDEVMKLHESVTWKGSQNILHDDISADQKVIDAHIKT